MERASHTPILRDLNTRLVRQALKDAHTATIRDLATATGLSTVTVGTIVQGLVAAGVAREGEQVPSNGGRPSRVYQFEGAHALALVVFTREIDGRDTACFRVADLYGRVIDGEDLVVTPSRLEDFEGPLDRLVARHPRVRALGFGLPGIEVGGTIVALDYGALVGAPILDHFQRRYQVPVVFENDVNAAALGRGRLEGAPGSEVYLYFPRKYAPGAGIRLDGKLLKGRRHLAGEVGFLPLGIPWGDPHLWDSTDALADAVARVVVSVAAVVDPDCIVLFGEFLSPEHLGAIEARCARTLPGDGSPTVALAPDFAADFQRGLIGLTLDLIEG